MASTAKKQTTTAITPLQVLDKAVASGVDAEKLGQLMELHERYEANEARKAFVRAMTEFRAKAIVVYRNKHVQFGQTNYHHATLDAAVEAAAPAMAEFGLSHRWETKQDGADIEVSCIITHEDGHSERTTMAAQADTSGAKNAIQAIGSAVSYLERYTFLAATGLVAKDQDDDGRGAGRIVSQDAIDYMAAVREHWDSIAYIKQELGLSGQDEANTAEHMLAALEAWRELGNDAMRVLWKAPSKGGVFTTLERKLLNEASALDFDPETGKSKTKAGGGPI